MESAACFYLLPTRGVIKSESRYESCQNRERTGAPRAGSPLGVVDATGSHNNL